MANRFYIQNYPLKFTPQLIWNQKQEQISYTKFYRLFFFITFIVQISNTFSVQVLQISTCAKTLKQCILFLQRNCDVHIK